MEKMQGQAEIYKGGKLICHFSTSRYDSANKSAAHIQGQIVRQIKRKIVELSADYADVYIHYSVLPNGPFLTRGIGKVQQ
jgi:hypothetical protein